MDLCVNGDVILFWYSNLFLQGPPDNPGLNQQALRYLFQHSEEMKDWSFIILVSFVEIYNEMLRDLLSPEPPAKLNVKQQKDGLHIPGLTHVKVSSVKDVNEVSVTTEVKRTKKPR